MIEGKQIDAVLTDDETELVTIINGLEEQAQTLEGKVDSIKKSSNLMTLGSVTFLGLYFLEKGAADRFEYLLISAACTIGGIERLVRERKTIRSIRSKNMLANNLKQELEPTDLERYEERGELFIDDEDDEEWG